jgi:hypothetical protein
MEDAFDGTETVCVGYERKGHSTVVTADRPVTFDQNDELAAFFKEKMKVGATLYKENKTGLFQVRLNTAYDIATSTITDLAQRAQEKFGQLNILQRKKGSAGLKNTKDAFKTLGVAMLPLHEIAQSSTGLVDRSLRLQWCMSERARLVVSAEVLVDGVNHPEHDNAAVIDDNESVVSAASQPTKPATSYPSIAPKAPLSYSAPPPSQPSALLSTRSTASTGNGGDSDMRKRIDELELALLNSAEVVESERAKAKEAQLRAESAEIEYRQKATLLGDASGSAQMKQLHQELNTMRESNTSLHETVAKYATEADKLRDSLISAHDEIDKLSAEKSRLEKALREKNDECESLLAELIKSKMSVGDLSTELDELKRTLKLAKQVPSTGGGGHSGANGAAGRGPSQQRRSIDGEGHPNGGGLGRGQGGRGNPNGPPNGGEQMPPPVARRASTNVNNNGGQGMNDSYNGQSKSGSPAQQQQYAQQPPTVPRSQPPAMQQKPMQSVPTPQQQQPFSAASRRTSDFNGAAYSSNSANANNVSGYGHAADPYNQGGMNMRTPQRGMDDYGSNSNNAYNSNYSVNSSSSSSSAAVGNGGGLNGPNNGSLMMRGFGESASGSVPSSATKSSNPIAEGFGSLRRGFDSMSSNLLNPVSGSGSNPVGSGSSVASSGAKRPPPSRPVF